MTNQKLFFTGTLGSEVKIDDSGAGLSQVFGSTGPMSVALISYEHEENPAVGGYDHKEWRSFLSKQVLITVEIRECDDLPVGFVYDDQKKELRADPGGFTIASQISENKAWGLAHSLMEPAHLAAREELQGEVDDLRRELAWALATLDDLEHEEDLRKRTKPERIRKKAEELGWHGLFEGDE